LWRWPFTGPTISSDDVHLLCRPVYFPSQGIRVGASAPQPPKASAPETKKEEPGVRDKRINQEKLTELARILDRHGEERI